MILFSLEEKEAKWDLFKKKWATFGEFLAFFPIKNF